MRKILIISLLFGTLCVMGLKLSPDFKNADLNKTIAQTTSFRQNIDPIQA